MPEVKEKPTRTKPRLQPLGAAVDEIWSKREVKRKLDAQVTALKEEIDTMEQALLDRLQDEGLESVRGTRATVTVGNSVVADVEDWDAFWTYVIKNKHTQLLQRRVSDPAYRELLELETAKRKTIPGVQPFIKKALRLRSLA